MLNSFKRIFAICLIAFASLQSAQATVIYSSGSVVPSNIGSFTVSDTFTVEEGIEYSASFIDVFQNFDRFSMTVVDNDFNVVGSAISADDDTSLSFEFTAFSDAIYSVFLGGETESLSTYIAKIETVMPGQDDGDVNPIPVPGAVWMMGSAIIALVGFGRRKAA